MAHGQKQRRGDIEILPITYEQVMKDLNKYATKFNSFSRLSAQQKEFIRKCRGTNNPVGYGTMAKLWKQFGWGEISKQSMIDWTAKLLE